MFHRARLHTLTRQLHIVADAKQALGVRMNHLLASSPSLFSGSCRILAEPDVAKKVATAQDIHKQWTSGEIQLGNAAEVFVSDYPERPHEPVLVDVKQIAADEARHFGLVDARLRELGSYYGAIPAHKTLWDHALSTKEDVFGRIAVVPLVQEARGLDAGPRLVGKLRAERDPTSAEIVQMICDEEERHVRHGMKWFTWLCERDGKEPVAEFHRLVRLYMKAGLARPFNTKARAAAGMQEDWYMPVEMDTLRAEARAAQV